MSASEKTIAEPIRIWTSAQDLSCEDALALPMQSVSTLWNGKPAPYRFEFSFTVTPDCFLFCARSSLTPWLFYANRGEYYEGLWERDVIELFITEESGESYREIHLSPNCLWWNARFQSYRKRDDSFCRAPAPIASCGVLEPAGWQAAVSIPASVLHFDFRDAETKRANVSAIFGPERSYMSYYPMQLAEPDFHRSDLFGAYELQRSNK